MIPLAFEGISIVPHWVFTMSNNILRVRKNFNRMRGEIP